MDRRVKEILRKIKSLEIQGARNVALQSLKAVEAHAASFKGSREKLFESTLKLMIDLSSLRETEPMQRNLLSLLREFYTDAFNEGTFSKALIKSSVKALTKEIEASFEALTDIASNLMEGVIATFCHSSTVEKAIVKAYRRGEVEKVVAFETRPRYQGRKTAQALAKAKVPVEFYVDGAMAQALKKVDYIFVGADAFTSEGHLLNKVGTHTLSIVAKAFGIPLYSVAEVLKYDPHTEYGFKERIEQRPPEEVWDKPPRGVAVKNPAFDLVPNGNISGVITEKGVTSPLRLSMIFEERMGELKKALKRL